MNKINISTFYLSLLLSVLFTSCSDYLTLYPEDDLVDDQYWNEGSKVENVVASCYRYTCDNNVLTKMIMWGEMRSDNVAFSKGSTAEQDFQECTITSSNSYVKWDGFYKVINICNNVIAKAPSVMEKDPNYNQTKCNNNLAEAYMMRGLMYFYLVRSFGDVPYITEPSDSEQKDYMVPQTSADEVIANIISDMETLALPMAADEWTTPEHTHGRVTKNAVRAFLADLYLWKGSDKQAGKDSQVSDNEKCIEYCNAILNDQTSIFLFCDPSTRYKEVFYTGNSTESIFELNFVTNGLENVATKNLYGNSVKSATAKFTPTTTLCQLYDELDQRSYQYIQINNGGSSYNIFKYEGQSAPTSPLGTSYTYRTSGNYANWIVYRLAEIYLMKAEALAEIAVLTQDNGKANEATDACNVVYKISNNEATLPYVELTEIENQVYSERRRELCFEGKRWYDLIRMNRREGTTVKALALLSGARSTESLELNARLSTADAWFLPIAESEMNANTNLKQNSYYSLTER